MNLTTAQKVTLKADIVAKQAVAQPLFGVTDETAIAAYYNTTGTFITWKSNVGIGSIGDKINGTELAGLSTLNTTRLQTVIQLAPSGVNPSLVDRRQFFDDIFSGAGGTTTRAQLLALWKRATNRVEQLFASGTGSDASPATLLVEGTLTAQNVSDAINGL